MPRIETPEPETAKARYEPKITATKDFPVREYVGSMAVELARMARWDGDETLACALEVAAEIASRPIHRRPVE